jgi:hypothetical protein
MNKVQVTGQLINKGGITLFLADGTSKILPQDSWQTKDILAAILPQLAEFKPAEIDLDAFAVSKKIAAAVPSAKFSEHGSKMSVTVENGTIKDAKGLLSHMERAVYGGHSKGFKTFMGYVNDSLKRRRYSMDEFMKFLEGADLPIADDGCILGFKVLNTPDSAGFMTDHHSGKVKQRLGSLVYMPNSKVDQSRALCSTGLHIAARSYLSGFHSGRSALCLVKIKPGDVVSVPYDETSKMRVSAYHIVKVFSKEDGNAITNGTKIETLKVAAKMLAEAVVGNHEPILETVKVTGMGEIVVTLNPNARPRKVQKLRPVEDIVSKRIDPKEVKEQFKQMQKKTFWGGVAEKLGFKKAVAPISAPVVIPPQRKYVVEEPEVIDNNGHHDTGASWSEQYAPEIKPAELSIVTTIAKVAVAPYSPEAVAAIIEQPKLHVENGGFSVPATFVGLSKPKKPKAKKPATGKVEAAYTKKLAAAQKLYDNKKMSIRDIAKKLKMDRESLGKNLIRKAA